MPSPPTRLGSGRHQACRAGRSVVLAGPETPTSVPDHCPFLLCGFCPRRAPPLWRTGSVLPHRKQAVMAGRIL